MALAGCLLLTACTKEGDGQTRADNYLQRLTRALDTDLPAARETVLPRINDAGIEPIAVPPAAITVLEFLSLSGCELQVNLGRRNSSLGRNASPSQRLLLDLEFLQLAPACTQYLMTEGNRELAQTIEAIAEERRQQLPVRIYNAVLAGPEFQLFWRLPDTLEDYPANTGGDVVTALTYFATMIPRWLNGQYQADNSMVEAQLAKLRSGDGGALLVAAGLQSDALYRANSALKTRSASRPLCDARLETSEARITQTVVAKYFAGDFQRWLARVNQRHHVLIKPVQQVEASLVDSLPITYLGWRQARDKVLASLTEDPRDHVDQIKSALAKCPNVKWG